MYIEEDIEQLLFRKKKENKTISRNRDVQTWTSHSGRREWTKGWLIKFPVYKTYLLISNMQIGDVKAGNAYFTIKSKLKKNTTWFSLFYNISVRDL